MFVSIDFEQLAIDLLKWMRFEAHKQQLTTISPMGILSMEINKAI